MRTERTVTAPEVFDYARAPKEPGPSACPACELLVPRVSEPSLASDRYGFDVKIDQCVGCGMTWLAERMTPAAYADFYEKAYRPLVSWFHGREITSETIKPEQREYAARLLRVLPALPPGGRLLDVGGANGIVACELARRSGLRPTILDPAPSPDPENGLEVLKGLAEDGLPDRQWDVILLAQTIDHLLNPEAVLRRLRGALAPGGLLWVDALDYEITQELKIDHPHNFTEWALVRLLDRTGWTITGQARWNRHVGFVCA